MAGIVLADLMNPLTKIEKLSEGISNSLSDLSSNIVKYLTSSQSFQKQILTQSTNIVKYLTDTQIFQQKMLDHFTSQSLLLTAIRDNTAKSSKSLLKTGFTVFMFIRRYLKQRAAAKATKEFREKNLALLTDISRKLDGSAYRARSESRNKGSKERDTKKRGVSDTLKAGSETLVYLGKSILKFAALIALATPLILLSSPAVPAFLALAGTLSIVVAGLGKVEKYVKKGSDVLDEMAVGLGKFAFAMFLISLDVEDSFSLPVLKHVSMGIILIGTAVAIIGKFDKSAKRGSSALKSMGSGLAIFAVGYGIFSLIFNNIIVNTSILEMQAATILIIATAVGLIGIADKSIKKGAMALASLGIGLGVFGVGYGIFSKMIGQLDLRQLILQFTLLTGLTGVMFLVSKVGIGNVAKGALAIGLLGPGLLSFGLGYSVFAGSFKTITISDIGFQLLVIGGISIIAAGVGILLSSIAKGALALTLLGVAIGIFGFGYSKFAENTKGLSFADVGIQLLILGGITAVAGIAGALMMAAGVPALGALAIALLGPALWAFSWGYSEFAKATEDANMESVKTQLLLLGGMVVVTSLAGLALPLVLLGAVSLGLIGLGVFGLSFGLKKYKEIGWTLDDSANLTGTISSLLTAFGAVPPGGAGGGGGDAGFFGFLGDMGQTVGNIIKGGLGAVAVIANALSLIVIGASVATLAMGLKPYKELGWQDSDTDTLTHLMKSLMGVFSGSGESGGVLSALGGLVKSGINAATATVNTGIFFIVSKVIPALAKGLKSYSDVGWNMDKTKILIGSMIAISKSVAGFDKVNNKATSKFRKVMYALSKNAGGLMEAADGVKAIADAINSIDITKADSMSKFFNAATEYSKSSDSDAMESLIETVAEIRDSINSLGQSEIQVEGTATTGGGNDNKSLGESLAKLQITLNQINATMSNLPADIAAIEIRLPQD